MKDVLNAKLEVFPAHAGVIPRLIVSYSLLMCIPRTRGGDPINSPVMNLKISYSPAHAGVILGNSDTEIQLISIPRTRGGDPRN